MARAVLAATASVLDRAWRCMSGPLRRWLRPRPASQCRR